MLLRFVLKSLGAGDEIFLIMCTQALKNKHKIKLHYPNEAQLLLHGLHLERNDDKRPPYCRMSCVLD